MRRGVASRLSITAAGIGCGCRPDLLRLALLLAAAVAGCHSGGSRKVGEPCSSNEDCATSSYGQVVCACHDPVLNRALAHDVARCQIGATVGQVCTNGEEGDPEPICELGSTCERDIYAHKFVCVSHAPTAPPGGLNQDCRHSGFVCQGELVCDVTTAICMVSPDLPDGEEASGRPERCKSRFSFRDRCAHPGVRDGACSPGWGTCEAGLGCFVEDKAMEGVCVPLLPEGARCRGDWTCGSRYCRAGSCAAIPEGGMVCRDW